MTTARELAKRMTPTAPPAIESALPTKQVKYTLLMTPEDADALDHLLLRVRRTSGRRVTKSQLIRSLLRLTLADTSLLEQAIAAA